MIVNGFDGRNVVIVMDVVQAKAIRAMLQNASEEQYKQASEAMKIDGHPLNLQDVSVIADSFVITLRKIALAVNEKPEPDVNYVVESSTAKPN